MLLGLVPTRTVLTANPNPTVLGSPLTLTATVSVPPPGYGVPADSVRFFDGTTLLGTSPVNSGVAGLALASQYLGDRALTAVYKGDWKRLGSISATHTLRAVYTARPMITSIADVKGDQGLQVRLRFRASPYDYPGSGTPITKYDVFRRVHPSFAAVRAPSGTGPASSAGTRPTRVMVDGWDFVGSLSARADSAYILVVPTLADSNASGINRATLFVSAVTATPSVYFDSAPDSGYSVDNLPPVPPSPFTGAYASGATHLHWGANTELDLWHYKVYRGSSAGFVPGPGNTIASPSDTGYADVGQAGSYYKLSAVDVNGNESGYALLTPAGTTSVPGGDTPNSPSLACDRTRPAAIGWACRSRCPHRRAPISNCSMSAAAES